MGRHRDDGTQHMEGDLFEDPPTGRGFKIPNVPPIEKPDLNVGISDASLSPDHY